MATKPKSKAVSEYRREISLYLQTVALGTGWKTAEMGARAGKLSHSTIGRAIKEQHTLAFPALMALESQSGIPIPESLRGAAIAAQQPTTTRGTQSEPDALEDEFDKLAPEAQREFLRKLEARLKRAG